MWDRSQMAARAAKEIRNGMYVNLGIGIPTLVSNFIPNDINIIENVNTLILLTNLIKSL